MEEPNKAENIGSLSSAESSLHLEAAFPTLSEEVNSEEPVMVSLSLPVFIDPLQDPLLSSPFASRPVSKLPKGWCRKYHLEEITACFQPI